MKVAGRWVEREGLLRSPLLEATGVVVAFTTRPLGSMGGSIPRPEHVRARAAVARALGFADVVRVKQVHGARVVRADGPFGHPWPEADALWTDRPGVLLGIVAADCVPVIVADREGPIGIAHAGWQGTSLGIARALVRALRDAGARPERMAAAVGPSIGPCCYTIDAGRAATVRERLGADADAVLAERDGHIVLDLWAANAAQLRAAGVEAVEVAGTCTRSGDADLWSYRARDRMDAGLGLAVAGRRG